MPSFKIIGLLVLDFLKVFAIYSHPGHLGYVTWIIFKILCPLPKVIMLHMKFGFDWPKGFRETDDDG